MVGFGKIAGAVLVLVGLAVAVLGCLWLLSGAALEKLDTPAIILGLGLLILFIVIPLIAFGTFLWLRGSAESREFAQLAKERAILNAVSTRGQVHVADLALELKMSRGEFKDCLYDLVGKELFTGYVDWKEGILYAQEAAQMATGKCPGCGAPRSIGGKGIIKCEYCGADLFIPSTI